MTNKLIGKCFKNNFKTVGKIIDIYTCRGIEYIEYDEFNVCEHDDMEYYIKFSYERDIWKMKNKNGFFNYFTEEITEQEFEDFIFSEVKKEVDKNGNKTANKH